MENTEESRTTIIGHDAEDRALVLLQRSGLQFVARNYRCRMGEIDLIMRDVATLVFVEVRRRRHSHYGTGAESVTRKKQLKVIGAALHFLGRNPAWRASPMRFDVVSLDGGPEHEPMSINWYRDAFSAD